MSCLAQSPSEKNFRSFIQQRGDSLLSSQKLPGLFVGVLNKGRRDYFPFGYAIPAGKISFDSATLFEAGSITKTLTALVVESVLREKGIADTSAIGPYLPEFVRGNYTLAAVTFRSLLNHTSGLPRLPGNLAISGTAPYDSYTEKELFAFLNQATPEPSGRSEYSNLGMGLVGVLAQRISGKDFPALLEQYVFMPFGLRKNHRTMERQLIAQGYFDQDPVAFWNMAALAPAGSWQTTADELLTYLQGMSEPTARTKEIVVGLLKPTVRVSPTVQVAKAWHTFEQIAKPTIYWHNGGTYGFSTFAAFVPGTGKAVVVIANRFNANNVTDAFGVAIARQLLNE